MMETGYVILNLKPGMKKEFLGRVKTVKGVTEARVVIGIFDAIVKMEAETIEELERIYLNEIDKISGLVGSGLHIVACPRTRK
ncbi:MAG: Lrp/AsnC ligand binding domain-containing protein [Candidatus Bathyarchaeota archaeon]|nr:Lrp/AsnC ligand binding domain-containing protein [Candidatus Bathyarchaeota archaeon]